MLFWIVWRLRIRLLLHAFTTTIIIIVLSQQTIFAPIDLSPREDSYRFVKPVKLVQRRIHMVPGSLTRAAKLLSA